MHRDLCHFRAAYCNTVYTNVCDSVGVARGVSKGAGLSVLVMVVGIAITTDRRYLAVALAEC